MGDNVRILLDLVEQLTPLAEGMEARIAVPSVEDAALAEAWCRQVGNTIVAAGDGWVTVRRGRASARAEADAVPAERRPGVRLWIYTNFDCNLQCSYCCVRSSPRAPRRALGSERIARLAREAVPAGVQEIFLTGGEPFLVPDIGASIQACAEVLPTTVLTNAMLFTGPRLEVLKSLPRTNLALQISLDSPTPQRHDRNRGPGTWEKTVQGIGIVRDLGFRVRIAATVDPGDREAAADEPAFHALLDTWNIDASDRLIRPVAQRGKADRGVAVSLEAVIPEITVTASGVFWHPVAADDEDMFVTREILPLQPAIDTVTAIFEAHRNQAAVAAQRFPCA